MKKIITILIILLSISCSTGETVAEEPVVVEEIVPKEIKIIITTTQPEFDEIQVAYQEIPDETKPWTFGPRQFEYEANGTPIPIVITLTDYKYDTFVGNAYRNNDLPSSLKVKLLVNDKLVLEVESTGSKGVYATVDFGHDIE